MRREGLTVLIAVLSVTATQLLAAEPEKRAAERAAALGEARDLREGLAEVQSIVEAMSRRDGHRGDAAERLREAVRTGKTDADSFAAIASWVLHAKEEDVARGMAAALSGVNLAGKGREGARWDPTARAMVDVLVAALGEAQRHERRGADSLSPEMARLVTTARPALAATLREMDPETLASLASTARALGGAPMGDLADRMLEALRNDAGEAQPQ